MKRKIELAQIFNTLRHLPPEVSFTQVEQWIHQYRPPALKPSSRLPSWLVKWKYWN